MKRLLILILAGCCIAPTAPSQGLDPRLEKVRSLMSSNLRRIPNYTCTMTVDRSIRQANQRSRNFSPPQPIRHSDTLRVEVAEVDGKELIGLPGSKLGDQTLEEVGQTGLIATGDFATLAIVVFRTHDPVLAFVGEKKLNGHPALEFSYSVAKEVSQYEVRAGDRKAIVAHHGFFWADPATLELLRLESRMDDIPSELGFKRTDTTIDYQKLRIGTSDFLLPAKVDRQVENRDGSGMRNVSTFTNCHQYGTETTLRFDVDEKAPAATASATTGAAPSLASAPSAASGTSAASAPSAASGTPAPVTDAHLPAGVRLPLQIQTAIDRKKSAIGDEVVATLMEEIHSGDIVLPVGSQARGRIRNFQSLNNGEYALELQFTDLECGNLTAHFTAFVEGVEKTKGVHYSGALTHPTLLLDRFPASGFTVYLRTSR